MSQLQNRCPKTGRFNAMDLVDDGTLDTVIRCSECGADLRYNFTEYATEDGTDFEAAYGAFVEWAIQEARSDHQEEES